MSESNAVMAALYDAFRGTDSYQCMQYSVNYEVLVPGYFCRLYYVGETEILIGRRSIARRFNLFGTVLPCSPLEAVPLLYEFYKGLAT